MESPLTVIDGIVIIVIALSAILAMARGFTREVLGILSVLAASLCAVYGAVPASPLVASVIDLSPISDKLGMGEASIAGWITGGLLFLVCWIIFTILTHKLSNFVSDSAVGGIDRFLGFVFGALRGLFILGVIYTVYTYFVPKQNFSPVLTSSKTLGLLDGSSDFILRISKDILPEEVAKGIDDHQKNDRKEDAPKKKLVDEIILEDAAKKDSEKQKNNDKSESTPHEKSDITKENLPELDTDTIDAVLGTLQKR